MGILDQGVDWSGVDETSQGDFSPIPEGQYTIEGVSFERDYLQFREPRCGHSVQNCWSDSREQKDL